MWAEKTECIACEWAWRAGRVGNGPGTDGGRYGDSCNDLWGTVGGRLGDGCNGLRETVVMTCGGGKSVILSAK